MPSGVSATRETSKRSVETKKVFIMNELILSQNPAVKRLKDTMNELQSLCRQVTENYRPMLNGERYLTDEETSQALKISRRTLQEYRSNGRIPFVLLGGKVLYRESDLEALLQKGYHPARRTRDDG